MTQDIDQFNKYVAITLSQLYESFPVKIILDSRKISGQWDAKRHNKNLWVSDLEPEIQVAHATIEWLVDNRFVHADSISDRGHFYGCALTISGLKLLNSIPEGVQHSTETLGQRLIREIQEGGIDAAKGLIIQSFTSGLG